MLKQIVGKGGGGWRTEICGAFGSDWLQCRYLLDYFLGSKLGNLNRNSSKILPEFKCLTNPELYMGVQGLGQPQYPTIRV